MVQKIQGGQKDFSGGEIDSSFKRGDDDKKRLASCRQMLNWRILSTHAVQNRSGRSAKFLETGRVEEVTMSPGNRFYLVFGNTYLRVYTTAGVKVYDSGNVMPWATATLPQVVWDIYQKSIYICFPGNIPQVLSWDGVTTWSIANFAEAFNNNQKRTFFYRISPQGITLTPGANTGAGVALVFSAPVLKAGHVGTRIRYNGRQILITAVTDSQNGTGTIEETLLGGQRLTFAVTPVGQYSVGDVVLGTPSGATGIVAGFAGGGFTMDVALTSPTLFHFGLSNADPNDTVVGPTGSLALSTYPSSISPPALLVWDEEVMNTLQGYPAACFVDQNRLGFCNFPTVPNGIGWSAIGNVTDMYVGATPDSAIFELAPRKSQVLYVLAGPESAEFVFCDNGVYYIPITVTDPLKPGSVAFNLVSTDACAANVQPRVLQDVILWINAGLTSVMAITAPGAYNRPYEVRNLSTLHSHLIKSPIAIAAPTTAAQFDERYAYVLNSDGTLAVGAYNIENGQVKGTVGWVPFNGAGTINWISALTSRVNMNTSYTPNGISAVGIVERLDDTLYLDAVMSVNSAPAAFAPPSGKGPLWYLANGSVTLMDQSTRMMGTYLIDANGFIIPQNNGGEDLTAATLMAGQPWTAILEPFAPDANSGADVGQRMFKRRVSRMAVYVMNSTGFLMARLFSGPITRTSPALGTVMNQRRVTAWNQDDDPTLAPPLREEAQRWRPIGRAFDPRMAIIKDTPGPLIVAEVGMEATI